MQFVPVFRRVGVIARFIARTWREALSSFETAAIAVIAGCSIADTTDVVAACNFFGTVVVIGRIVATVATVAAVTAIATAVTFAVTVFAVVAIVDRAADASVCLVLVSERVAAGVAAIRGFTLASNDTLGAAPDDLIIASTERGTAAVIRGGACGVLILCTHHDIPGDIESVDVHC